MERSEIRGGPLHAIPHCASLHAGYLLLPAEKAKTLSSVGADVAKSNAVRAGGLQRS
jgi:hypothetical protein